MTQLPQSSQPQQGSTKLVLVALAIAVVAVILVNLYIGYVRSQAREGEFMVYKLMTSVEPGDTLREEMIEPHPIPDSFKDSFSDAVTEEGLQTQLDQQVQRYAARNDVLRYDLFIPPTQNELDRRISDGMRLVALPVETQRIPGDLRPGMYVDIEAPFRTGQGVRILPVMEQVKVMIVGDFSIVDATEAGSNDVSVSGYRNISVEVTPEQATQLATVSNMITGNFEIQVRNPGDDARPKIPEGGLNPRVVQLIEQRQNNATAQQ